MRRRLLLLSAGFLAYQFGAAVNLYLRSPELCSCAELPCRITYVIEHRREALAHPLLAAETLFAPVCN